MLESFYRDLNNAKGAEQIVLNTFSALSDRYTFQDVSNIKEYYYRGDILAVDKCTGREVAIEVKDDSRIADTRNILCEDEVYYKSGCYSKRGNMHSNSDVYTIVSKAEQRIYVIDFKALKANYKRGEFKVIYHAQQDTYCYLLPLATLKRAGGLIAIVDYGTNDITLY